MDRIPGVSRFWHFCEMAPISSTRQGVAPRDGRFWCQFFALVSRFAGWANQERLCNHVARESHGAAAEDATREISFEHEGHKPVLIFSSVVTLCELRHEVRSGVTLQAACQSERETKDWPRTTYPWPTSDSSHLRGLTRVSVSLALAT